MSSITAQQTKLDLELVPEENRLDIGKCNGRIPRGLTPREPTFQVVLDAIVLTPCYPTFLITVDVPKVYMHQFWNSVYKHDTFYRFKLDKKKQFKLTLEVFKDIFQICPRVQGRDFDALPSEEDIMSFLRELNHTKEINSLNYVVVDQMYQPWRTFAALINRGLSGKTSGLDKLRLSRAQILWVYKKQEKMYYPRFTKVIIHHFLIQDKTLSWRNRIGMHTSKDDYLINTLIFVSAKEATQIYGVVLLECLTSPEMKDSKAYKTYLGYATGVVPPKIARKFKKASPSKKDSNLVPVDEEHVQKGKRVKRPSKKSTTTPAAGIIIREAPVETKSKRKEKERVDIAHGKGIELFSDVALTEEAQMKEVRMKSLRDFHKTHPSGSGIVAKKPPRVEKITHTVTSEGTGDKPRVPDVTKDDSTESESESWGNDEDDSNNEQESSNESSEQENESDDDETQSDSFDDDVDARLNEPTQTDREVVQNEGADAQQWNENIVTTQEQVVDDAHVTISTVTKKTEEIVSPLDVHVHHEVPRTHASTLLTIPVSVSLNHHRITALEKEVVELKKDPLHTQVTTLVDEHLDTRLGETREEFMNFLLESLMARIKEQVKEQLPQNLPKEVSNFAPLVIEALIKESRDKVTLAKVYSQPRSTYKAAFTHTEFELKKILIDKMEKSESYLAAPEHRDFYDSLKKSYNLKKDFFFSYDVYTMKRSQKTKTKMKTLPLDQTEDMLQDQEGNLGDNDDEPRKEDASRRDWFKKPTPPQEPIDPNWHEGKTP
ncbi:hypothetical protein Tco_1082879 [Tanacetum coccineum]|uniref:Uncharacterized protein n=1 Tax=Tanacetum coccineum TaxID=301880 RepID=A0ABQ5I2X7_9ASTR